MHRSAFAPIWLMLTLIVPASPALAESTRTLRLELSPDATPKFAVENLVGEMQVRPGKGPKVVAIATVRAENDELARGMRFEQVRDKDGTPTLRVRYPLDRSQTLRYGDAGASFSRTQTDYDGHRVTISGSKGVVLYADVEVQIPPRSVQARFRNAVGTMDAKGIQGNLWFDAGSGDVTLAQLKGEIHSDSGSGNVKAEDLEGSLSCDTGSGNVDLERFRGEKIDCDVGSGNVRLRGVSARRIRVDTGSGDIRLSDAEMEEFDADTGSGNVLLEARGSRLARVKADTGSGDVTLRLGPGATFEALADQGSGDITVHYPDAAPIVRGKEVVGYRRGDGKIRIDVDTGSGNLVIEPGA